MLYNNLYNCTIIVLSKQGVLRHREKSSLLSTKFFAINRKKVNLEKTFAECFNSFTKYIFLSIKIFSLQKFIVKETNKQKRRFVNDNHDFLKIFVRHPVYILE